MLVVCKGRPHMMARAAHEEDGLQKRLAESRATFSNKSLPFPFRRCAAATGRKRRLLRDNPRFCTELRRVGAVQINLSANAAEQISPYAEKRCS